MFLQHNNCLLHPHANRHAILVLPKYAKGCPWVCQTIGPNPRVETANSLALGRGQPHEALHDAHVPLTRPPTPWTETIRPRISVIIPTFNRLTKLKNALASLRRQTCPPDSFDIIVVDDGSTDETLKWLRKAAGELGSLHVLSQKHAGPAAARNLATSEARGEILLFMGDDVIASERLLEIHLKTYETMGPNIAVQGGVRLASSVPMTRFVRYLDKRSAAQFQLGNARPGDVLPFFSFYTCNCSVPRELVEACGGFPQDVVYYDDTFLGWMLERKGIPIIYEPLAEVQHDHAQTLDEFLLRQRQAGKDAAILAARHSELRKPLRVDQAALFEGNVWEIAKKVVKMLLFNRWTVRILKKMSESRVLPFTVSSIIFSGLIGYEHRAAARRQKPRA